MDLAVLDRRTSSVVLIAEIEESGTDPKKIIGDAANLSLADGIRIASRDYDLGQPLILLASLSDLRQQSRV